MGWGGGLTAPARPISAGTGSGAVSRQGVGTPWPLASAQKGTQKKTNHQKTPRDRVEKNRVKRKHYRGGQKARD